MCGSRSMCASYYVHGFLPKACPCTSVFMLVFMLAARVRVCVACVSVLECVSIWSMCVHGHTLCARYQSVYIHACEGKCALWSVHMWCVCKGMCWYVYLCTCACSWFACLCIFVAFWWVGKETQITFVCMCAQKDKKLDIVIIGLFIIRHLYPSMRGWCAVCTHLWVHRKCFEI